MSKLLISIDNLNELPSADGYVLGYEKYTFFSKHRFSYQEIKEFAHPEKNYLLLNAMLHEKEVDDFKKEAQKLSKLNINFIVQDLGMVEILKALIDPSHIIYNPYTLVCNLEEYQTYMAHLGVSIGVSSQLSIDNLKHFKGQSMITIFGYVPIYQSFRKVISLYEEHYGVETKKETMVKEDTRDEIHHILENEYGSVIFSSEPVNLLEHISLLNDSEYLFIDTSYISQEEIKSVFKELKR